jgi:hypothetical protein
MEQLEAFLQAADVTLPADVLDRVDEIVTPRRGSTPPTTATARSSCKAASGAAKDDVVPPA